MSNLPWAEMDGAAPARCRRPRPSHHSGGATTLATAARGGAVRIGRASSADVCFSEDSQVSRVHARPGAGPRPVDDRLAGGWTQSDPRPYIGERSGLCRPSAVLRPDSGTMPGRIRAKPRCSWHAPLRTPVDRGGPIPQSGRRPSRPYHARDPPFLPTCITMHRRSPSELPDLPRWVCVLVLLGVGLHLLGDLRHRGVRPGPCWLAPLRWRSKEE